jgi:hypothetical protein
MHPAGPAPTITTSYLCSILVVYFYFAHHSLTQCKNTTLQAILY